MILEIFWGTFLIVVSSFLCWFFNAYGWGFTRNNNHNTPSIGNYDEIINGTNSYYVGDVSRKTLYLTFDAGYDNGVLNDIIKVLDEILSLYFIIGVFPIVSKMLL